MMKIFRFTILLAFAWSVGLAQTKEAIDSLQHQLAIAKDDTSRVKEMVWLCLAYRLGNTDSSIFYGQKALTAARQINYPAGEILALSFLSYTTQQMGNLPKALEMAFKALQIGNAHQLENNAGALNAIGETYIMLKDYPKALNYLRQQETICATNGNIEAFAYAKKDIAVVFEAMNQLDSAQYYVQQAIENFRKKGREEPQTYEILGNIKMKSGNYKEALNFYQKGLQISIKNNERRASAGGYNKIASFYKSINQPDSAIYYATKGLEVSMAISQKTSILEAAALLSELYEQRDNKESLRYLKIANVYKDSVFGPGSLQAIQTLVTQQEEHQKEIDAAKKTYQTKLTQYGLLAGLVMFLVIAFILYRNNRRKQKANVLLLQQKEEIQSTLSQLKATQSQLIQSEKMASLGELTAGIAHEIQNPLNFVNNFSEVNKEMLEELKAERLKPNAERDDNLQDDILNDVIANEEKINHHGKRADAIVKGMLQHSQTSTGQKEPTDINKLADEYLRLSYHGLLAKDKSFNATLIPIAIGTDFDENIGNINIIPQDIGRVLLNLYNNAFYAVNEKHKAESLKPKAEGNTYEPEVTVTTRRLGSPPVGGDGGKILISVKDNGNGIPQKIIDKIFQPFFTTKPTGQGTGLGLSLSYDIIKAHGGEIKVETKEGEGTTFSIHLS
jgi:two-component system, NtrC family, sensor kinase